MLLLIFTGLLFTTAANAEAIEGPFRGTLVCGQLKTTNNILRAPLGVIIKGSNVMFARPIFNAKGTLVIGSELGSGTLDADGKLHLTATWENGDNGFTADYSGTLTAAGGTLTGTENWHLVEGLTDTRPCMAALVQVRVHRHEDATK